MYNIWLYTRICKIIMSSQYFPTSQWYYLYFIISSSLFFFTGCFNFSIIIAGRGLFSSYSESLKVDMDYCHVIFQFLTHPTNSSVSFLSFNINYLQNRQIVFLTFRTRHFCLTVKIKTPERDSCSLILEVIDILALSSLTIR